MSYFQNIADCICFVGSQTCASKFLINSGGAKSPSLVHIFAFLIKSILCHCIVIFYGILLLYEMKSLYCIVMTFVLHCIICFFNEFFLKIILEALEVIIFIINLFAVEFFCPNFLRLY